MRRHLYRWSNSDTRVIKPIICMIRDIHSQSSMRVSKPRWETNVYPLYYWAERAVGSRKAYDFILDILTDLFPAFNVPLPDKDVLAHLKRIMNSEIDILVEDITYFLFIEVKVPIAHRKAKFQIIAGIHQLVRQYIQGKILEGIISKPFTLVTIGANNGNLIKIPLNTVEQDLLRLVNEDRQCLEVDDLPLNLLVQDN